MEDDTGLTNDQYLAKLGRAIREPRNVGGSAASLLVEPDHFEQCDPVGLAPHEFNFCEPRG